ncbi:MAG: RNB domain-containing ribonuclease [Polyangiaceae bacterium]
MTSPRPPHHDTGPVTLRDIARSAMLERSLEPDFSSAALAEVAAIHAPAVPGAHETVRDLRDRLWVSIDNDDSRDLDQLSVAEPLSGGRTQISVAIADVDSLVVRGTALDDHAQTNTTSVYTAAQIFPMLPERLSTDLTSLNEGVARLAIVIELIVRADGTIESSDVYRANVHNHAKLAYNSVAAWLEDSAPPPPRVLAVPGVDEQLRLQDRVAQQLRKGRIEHGALTLETLEARPVFDGDTLADLVPEGSNRAKQLIEDLMIAANGVSARFLEQKGFGTLRRVLRSPERWLKIVAIAEALGETLPEQPSNLALEGFLRQRKAADPERFSDLSVSIVKLLGRGEYALNIPGQAATGHFGLALRDYTHSTAPNRRFPDLITQRLLKAALASRPAPYSNARLSELARQCTLQEDNAAKVERRVRKSAAALLLSRRIGQKFDAFVTGASEKGTWVRIARPAAEGKVVRGEHGLEVGDHIQVELLDVDFERGFVDFGRA